MARNSVGKVEVICDSFQLIMCDENEVIRETCFIACYFVNDEIGSRHLRYLGMTTLALG